VLDEDRARVPPWRVPEDLFVDSAGVRLAVRDFGGEGSPLVLVHGHYGNLAELDQLGALLARHGRVVAYDQRGQGWSERGPIGTEELARDLATVVESLDLDRPMLFGSSFGTLVCLAYIWHGGDAAGLISQDGRASDFADQGASPTPPSEPQRILDRRAWEEYVAGFGRIGEDGTSAAMRSGVRRPGGRYEVRPSPEDLFAKEQALVRLPVLDSYKKVAGPLLMLAAERGRPDRSHREAELRTFSELTGGTVRWFPTEHWISAQDPDGVVDAVRGVLGSR
jgi:pimeloyl-ACP methyl ester carboxylesterase